MSGERKFFSIFFRTRVLHFSRSAFWLGLSFLGLIGLALGWWLVEQGIETERDQMLDLMHERADSLIWAIEGGVRFLDGRHDEREIGKLLNEVSQQPGIAWISILNGCGQILVDSNGELTGRVLYSPAELAGLAPGAITKGRFSPYEPQIYETWKRFAPERLVGGQKPRLKNSPDKALPAYIFVAFDAAFFKTHLSTYARQLWLNAGLSIFAVLALLALGKLVYQYQISRRKLASAEALASQVIQSYPGGLAVTDAAGRLRLGNQLSRALFQLPDEKEALLCQSPLLSQAQWQEIFRELDENKRIAEREIILSRPELPDEPLNLSAIKISNPLLPAKSDSQAFCGYLFILREMGEIRRLEERLGQQERLSSLGNLAAGLAHELRNPLSAIRGYATYLAEKLKADPMARATAELLVTETERLNRVLGDLLSVARPSSLRLAECDLAELQRKAYALALPEAEAKGIALKSTNPFHEARITADADKLLQAIFNLLLNAIQATPSGGTVELSLSRSGDGWQIAVRDTGPGIPKEALKQIFTPYFSTKANGSGLGLPISQGIVARHGGSIQVTSHQGLDSGTIFRIILPGARHERTT